MTRSTAFCGAVFSFLYLRRRWFAAISLCLSLTLPTLGSSWRELNLERDPLNVSGLRRHLGSLDRKPGLVGANIDFETNLGQADPIARFVARARGHTVFLTDTGTIVNLSSKEGSRHTNIAMNLVGMSPTVQIHGEGKVSESTNYLLGEDSSKWIKDVSRFASIHYGGAYPGVDLKYYLNDEARIEFDFILSPGSDPNVIAMQYSGQQSLRIDEKGDLALKAAGHVLRYSKPVAFQMIGGKKRAVRAAYSLLGPDRVGFTLGRYDSKYPLTIDPFLIYSTYLGGSAKEEPAGLAVDGLGNAYIVGETDSIDFPVNPGFDNKCGTDGKCDQSTDNICNAAPPPDVSCASKPKDVFVSKVSSDGKSVVYSTYLGGKGDDRAIGIDVDSNGNVYVLGSTHSRDFPTTANAFDRSCGTDASANCDLRSKTHLDGRSRFSAFSAYRTPGNPTPWATETKADLFLTRLDQSGSHLVYSTFLGGSGEEGRAGSVIYYFDSGQRGDEALEDEGRNAIPTNGPHPGAIGGISVEGPDRVFVTAPTISTDFPLTVGALDKHCGPGATNDCGSRYFAEEPCITGGGVRLPDAAKVQPICTGYVEYLPDAVVAEVNTAMSGTASLTYSTYLGGGDADIPTGIDFWKSSSGSRFVYFSGYTGPRFGPKGAPQATWSSVSFPTTAGSFQSTRPGGDGPRNSSEGFVARLALGNTTKTLDYATFLGGTSEGQGQSFSGDDRATAIAVDKLGRAHVTGRTSSFGFPTTETALRRTKNFGKDSAGKDETPSYTSPSFDAFVTVLDPATTQVVSAIDKQLRLSTYLGGSGSAPSGEADDFGLAIAVDDSMRTVIAGRTNSPSFPTRHESSEVKPGSEGRPDGFLVALAGDHSLLFSSYVGGSSPAPGGTVFDEVRAVAVQKSRSSAEVFVTGVTGTNDFPYLNGPQPDNRGQLDVFVTKVSAVPLPPAPVILEIGPAHGPSSGGTLIELLGSALVEPVAVTFGNSRVSCPSMECRADPEGKRLLVMAPPHPEGKTSVSVETPSGRSAVNRTTTFTYYAGSWTGEAPTENMPLPRSEHTATSLLGPECMVEPKPPSHCGKILIVGGNGTNSVDLYDPRSRAWSSTVCPSASSGSGCLLTARPYGHTATLLPNGEVLVVGGATSKAEIYNPSSGTWRATGDMNVSRTRHTATLIEGSESVCGRNCGKVLVVGGTNPSTVSPTQDRTRAAATAEIFDPATGQWTLAAPPSDSRFGLHTSTLLPNGKIVVVGGDIPTSDYFGAEDSIEVFDPALGAWVAKITGLPRYGHSATLLQNGKVLIAGGVTGVSQGVGGGVALNNVTASSELFDPEAPADIALQNTNPMSAERSGHMAALVPSGEVLVIGGAGNLPGSAVTDRRPAFASAELFDPELNGGIGGWKPADALTTARGQGMLPGGHTATPIGLYDDKIYRAEICGTDCGKVFLFGGVSSSPDQDSLPQRRVSRNRQTAGFLNAFEVYTPAPSISSVEVVGEEVGIHGTGFYPELMDDPSAVRMGWISARSFRVESPKDIKALVPEHMTGGEPDVVVITRGVGMDYLPKAFSIESPGPSAAGQVDIGTARGGEGQAVPDAADALGGPNSRASVVQVPAPRPDPRRKNLIQESTAAQPSHLDRPPLLAPPASEQALASRRRLVADPADPQRPPTGLPWYLMAGSVATGLSTAAVLLLLWRRRHFQATMLRKGK